MEYLFVFSDGGWWLKLTDADQIIDYARKTDSRYEGALEMYMRWKQEGKDYEDAVMELPLTERIKLTQDRDFKYLQCAIIQARKIGGTILDGFRSLNMEIGAAYLQTIREHGAVYINPVGGKTFDVKYTQFCRRKELVFPEYKREDIRVKQFKGGQHWYAYIGDTQVRNGDQMKWNTYNKAFEAATALVSTLE